MAGDDVVVSCVQVDDQEPATHADGMPGAEQRIWGFETNFGGLAHYAAVRAGHLMPKPAHLTWEEAASTRLCAATSYRKTLRVGSGHLRPVRVRRPTRRTVVTCGSSTGYQHRFDNRYLWTNLKRIAGIGDHRLG